MPKNAQTTTQLHSSHTGGSEVKVSACNVRDLGSIPGSGKSPGEENGNPLQYSCLGNSRDREACWATVHRVTKSRTPLSDQHFHFLSRNFISFSIKITCYVMSPPRKNFTCSIMDRVLIMIISIKW